MAEIGKDRLVELSEAKLRDAKLLLASGSAGNAYYLAGYAVELMLKAILSAQFRTNTLPDRALVRDLFTHQLGKLVDLCRLSEDLKAKEDSDPKFRAFWQVVKGWTEASRYDDMGLDGAAALIEAIEEPGHGVMPWLHSKL